MEIEPTRVANIILDNKRRLRDNHRGTTTKSNTSDQHDIYIQCSSRNDCHGIFCLNYSAFFPRGMSSPQPFVPAACHRREAAEALKARNIPAQGKRAESARRPGYNGDYVRVPRPHWPQSAKLTGAKEAMELTFLVAMAHPERVLFARGRTLTWGCACGAPQAGMSHSSSVPVRADINASRIDP